MLLKSLYCPDYRYIISTMNGGEKMQLTKGFEQAVCILVLLSTQDSQAPLASDAINSHLQVSPSYLKKSCVNS